MAGKRNQQIRASPVGSPNNSSSGNTSDGSDNKEQDRFLPIANVSRIMKKSLPANAKISKEAKESIQECVSEFISFITGEASDKCQREKRKTINGDDLLWAMTTLGFQNYVGPLKMHLNKYRDVEDDDKVNNNSDPASAQHQQHSQHHPDYNVDVGPNVAHINGSHSHQFYQIGGYGSGEMGGPTTFMTVESAHLNLQGYNNDGVGNSSLAYSVGMPPRANKSYPDVAQRQIGYNDGRAVAAAHQLHPDRIGW